MDNILPKGSSTPADFPEATWAVNALKGIVFAGAFCGMIAMGYIGDLLGRRMGMMTTLSLVVVGSLGSAIAPWLPAGAVYYALTVLRFVLGFGVVRVVCGVRRPSGAMGSGDAAGTFSTWHLSARAYKRARGCEGRLQGVPKWEAGAVCRGGC